MEGVVVQGKDQSAETALLEPMSSNGARMLTHALVAEPYSSVQVQTGALQTVLCSGSRVPRAGWLCTERHGRGRHEEAVGRVGTTTRGYLQL